MYYIDLSAIAPSPATPMMHLSLSSSSISISRSTSYAPMCSLCFYSQCVTGCIGTFLLWFSDGLYEKRTASTCPVPLIFEYLDAGNHFNPIIIHSTGCVGPAL